MKKLLAALLCASITVFAFAGLTACTDPVSDREVNLVAITATEIGVRNDIDYYVVPEPAASTKVNAISSLEFSGDLQKLYGGDNGYTQAVVVAKKELTNYSFITEFMQSLQNNLQWLLSESTSAETIVEAVRSKLTEDLTPTFDANNLSKTVIENCGINFTAASSCKEEIKSFMQKLNAVSETQFGSPAEEFFFDGNSGTQTYSGSLKIYAPDGAPALGLAKLLAGEESFQNVDAEYHIVDSNLIQSYVTGDMSADICVLPVNLAVKLLGSGNNYKLLGTLTHGNLFLLSNGGQTITKDNLNSLVGKTVGVVNLAQIPGLTLKLILNDNGIAYKEPV